jgi:hypothetical protein
VNVLECPADGGARKINDFALHTRNYRWIREILYTTYFEKEGIMKRTFLLVVMLVGYASTVGAVSFTRYMIDDSLDRPHGNWSGDIKGDNPQWVMDAFGTIGHDHAVVWYENLGNGRTWGDKIEIFRSSMFCSEVAAGDFDGDNDVDAVSSHMSSFIGGDSEVYIHINDGNGTFTTTLLGTFEARARQQRVYDINNDTRLDIVVAGNSFRGQGYQSEIGVYWYRNDGGNNFTQIYLGTTSNPWKVDCIRNTNGHYDIVVSEQYCGVNQGDPSRLLLYKNDGSENFTMHVLDDDASVTWHGGVRCADLDDDGKIDIVTGRTLPVGVLYWYKNINGTNFQRIQIDGNCPELDGICICDPDVDGDSDIFAAGRASWFNWYENDGSGNFTPHSIETGFELLDLPYTTFLDGDSCCDILLSVDDFDGLGYFFAYLNPCFTSVEENDNTLSTTWLKAPSLINRNTVDLEYNIKSRGDVEIEIVSITGRAVQIIADGYRSEPGKHSTRWDLSDLPNGIYLLRLKTSQEPLAVTKVTVLR